ncbi:MAG: ABC transporter permease [Rhodospirillales bacterium]|nr:ABC transporter permease [Rhodospirillales bacterium]
MNEWIYEHRRKLLGFGSVILFFVIWEAIFSGLVKLNPLFMSKPSEIWVGFMYDLSSGKVLNELIVSGKPFLFGFFAAVVVGIFVGTFMGWREKVGYALDPFMTALYASPLVAVAPLMIIMFGVGVPAKAFLIFILSVFPFVFNTYAGVKSVDQVLINVVRSMGGNEKDIYFKVIVPSVLPFIVAGARYAIGRALVGILVGEFYAASAGVGYMIAFYGDMYAIDRMFAYILIMMVIAVAFTEGIRWAERTAFPWRVGM